MPDEPSLPEPPARQPTRELLLAQALDVCITAERRQVGSSHRIIARQPAWAQADLRYMVDLAMRLDEVASNGTLSPEFRRKARARLMQRIGGDVTSEPVALLSARLRAVPLLNGRYGGSHRKPWLWRSVACLAAAALGLAATLTASASALPGEPLYPVKQAEEELNVRLAADDQARALALLGQADARLDETARLLQQGRTAAALETTQRYDQVVQRATTTYVVTIDDTTASTPATLHLQTRLSQEQLALRAILETAPEPARADLREALVTTERGQALVADPRPVERALGRSNQPPLVLAAAQPTTAAEDEPTVVPTTRPTVAPAVPAPTVVLARPTDVPPSEPPLLAQSQGTSRIIEGVPFVRADLSDTSAGDGPLGDDGSAANGSGRGLGSDKPADGLDNPPLAADVLATAPPLVAHGSGSGSDRALSAVATASGATHAGGAADAPADSAVVAHAQPSHTGSGDGGGSGTAGDGTAASVHAGDEHASQPVAHDPSPLPRTPDQYPDGSGQRPGGGTPSASRLTAPPGGSHPDKPSVGAPTHQTSDVRTATPTLGERKPLAKTTPGERNTVPRSPVSGDKNKPPSGDKGKPASTPVPENHNHGGPGADLTLASVLVNAPDAHNRDSTKDRRPGH